MDRLWALLGAVTISFSAILVRLADDSPSTVAFFRTAYGLLALLLLAALPVFRDEARPARARWTAFGAGLLMGVSFTVWNYAIDAIGAGLSTVIGNSQVVFVGLLAWALYGERPNGVALAAVPVVFGGVLLASGLGRVEAYGEAPVLGALLSVVNALVYTTFLLVFRAVNRGRRSPARPLLDATAGAFAATLLLGVLTDPAFSLRPTWPAHGWLLLLGLGPQVMGWMLIMRALPRLPALDTSVILLAQPVLTVVWARLVFAEAPSPLQWAGVGLVLAGVALLSVTGSARRAPPSAAPDAVIRKP